MADSKVFNDPIHSSIQMPPYCQMIIDTPEFQRLRFIKQLGCSCYVFPSAVHTRFEHSIGVSHFAGKLADILLRQKDTNILSNEVICVEIAGLCHDLGHGPFLHAFEDIIPNEEDKEWTHKEQSVVVFEHIIKKYDKMKKNLEKDYNIRPPEIAFICELILGRPKQKGADLLRGDKFFLYQIVNNTVNNVDVNKWDYFARDTFYLGMKSAFDFNRIVPFVRVLEVKRDGETRKELCFRDKVANDLNHMFLTRRRLHYAAYGHRVTRIISMMLKDAFRAATDHLHFAGQDGKEYNLIQSVKDPVAFCQVNDTIINEIMRSKSQEPGMKKAREIIERIHNRKLYQCIGAYQYASEEPIHKPAFDQAKIKQQIVNNIDEFWQAGNIEVDVSYFDYGDDDQNPLLKIPFYDKSVGESKFFSREQLPVDLPQRLQDVTVTIYTKLSNLKEKTVEQARAKGERELRRIIEKIDIRRKANRSPTHKSTPVNLPVGTITGVVRSKEKENSVQPTVRSPTLKSHVMAGLTVSPEEPKLHKHDETWSSDAEEGRIHIDLTTQSSDIGRYGDITIQKLRDIPINMLREDDEVVITCGLQITSHGSEPSSPVIITLRHCAIFTDPDHARIVLYTGEKSSEKFTKLSSPLSSPVDEIPRCVVRKNDLDLHIDHFSQWWPVSVRKSYFLGKRLICTPCVPESLRLGRSNQIYLFLTEDIGMEEELPSARERASLREEFQVTWRTGNITITYFEDDVNVETQIVQEDALYSRFHRHIAFTVRSRGARLKFHVTQNTATGINFHFDLEGSTPPQSPQHPSTSSAADNVPQAFQRSRDAVPDDKLNTLATHIPHEKYADLSSKLGISFNLAGNILTKHGQDYKKAMRECLAIWKDRTGGSKAELEVILCRAELGGLVEHIK